MKHCHQKSSFFDKYFEPTRGMSLTGNVGSRFTLRKREDDSASHQDAEVLRKKKKLLLGFFLSHLFLDSSFSGFFLYFATAFTGHFHFTSLNQH